jgi:hypothetical protein
VKFFDGITHPPASTVIADGLDGGMLYLGTPSSGKDLTAAQYADYKAHGLLTAVGFEHVTTDWQGGAAAGKANAAAFLADAHAKGVSPDDPFWVAIDMHVAASDLPTVVAYVRAYVAAVRAGEWRGRAGGYGFPEVTTALHAAGVVDWYWGAGRRADQPAFINIWQDNTQTIQVGGSTDDEDWVLIAIPEETDMTDPGKLPDADTGGGTRWHDILNLFQQFTAGGRNQVPVITSGIAALKSELDALPAELKADLEASLAQTVTGGVAGTYPVTLTLGSATVATGSLVVGPPASPAAAP